MVNQQALAKFARLLRQPWTGWCCAAATSTLHSTATHMVRPTMRRAAQVENQQALANFEAIAAAADGVVLSRGNLGLDVLPEKTAIVQKAATTACNLIGKPVIITRVVDTMVTAPRCTR